MKRALILIALILTTLSVATLLDHLPKDYDSALYVPDLSKAYNAIKGTTIGSALLDMLGLESMADNFIASQLQAYDVDPEEFYSSLKELLVLSKDQDILVAVGPSKNPDKIKSAIEDISGATGTVNVVDDYLVFSTSQSLLDGFKTGGGELPVKEYLEDEKTLAVSYSRNPDAVVSGRAWFENGMLKSQSRTRALDQEGREVIESLRPKKTFENSDLIEGDAFVMVNTGNIEKIIEYMKDYGVKFTEIDENQLKKLGNEMLFCIEYSKAAVDMFQGSEESTELKLKGYVETSTTLQEIAQKNESCNLEGNELVCDDIHIAASGGKLWFYMPGKDVKLSGKAKEAFKDLYTGNEIVLVFADFSRILSEVFGLNEDSHLIITVWVEKDEIVSRLEIK